MASIFVVTGAIIFQKCSAERFVGPTVCWIGSKSVSQSGESLISIGLLKPVGLPGKIGKHLPTVVPVLESGLPDEFLRVGHPRIPEKPQCRAGKAGASVQVQGPGNMIQRVEQAAGHPDRRVAHHGNHFGHRETSPSNKEKQLSSRRHRQSVWPFRCARIH